MSYFRYFIPIIICLLLSFEAISQSSKIIFSPGDDYEIPKKHIDLGFAGNDKDGYIRVAHKEYVSLSLQKFSADCKLTGENIVSIKNDMPTDYRSEMLRTIGNKHYWFFSSWNRKEEKQSLHVQEIDVKNNSLTGHARVLISSEKITGVPDILQVVSKDARKGNRYVFYFSHDRSKLLIVYRRPPEVKNDNFNKDKIGLCVFNLTKDSLLPMWQQEVVMPYNEEKMDNDDYRVDTHGNAYLLVKVYTDNKKNKNTQSIFRYELLKWSAESTMPVKIPFASKNKFIRHAFLQDDNDNMIVLGYYSTKEGQNIRELNGTPPNSMSTTPESVDGAFVLKLNLQKTDLQEFDSGFFEFPSELIGAFESSFRQKRAEKNDKKGKAEILNMCLNSFNLNKDGSVSLFGEEYYYSPGGNGGGGHTPSIHYSDDIYGVSVDSNGKLKWMVKIPKRQEGVDTKESLFFSSISRDGNTYVFFADNPKNNEQPEGVPAIYKVGSKNSVLALVQIDEQGKTNKSEIYNTGDEEQYIDIAGLQIMSNTQIITHITGKKKDKIAAIYIH